MISEFIYTGNFNDPFSEFFIEKIYKMKVDTELIPDNEQHLFKLTSDPYKIPSFIGVSIAQAIFKVGSHVNLLQMLDSWSNNQGSLQVAIPNLSTSSFDKKDYFDICNVSTQHYKNNLSGVQKAVKAFVHPTRIISE